jgi:hypothetical protein
MGHHPADRAAHYSRRPRLDADPKPRLVALDTGHVQSGKPDENVATLAVAVVDTATGRKIGHRGPRNQVVW